MKEFGKERRRETVLKRRGGAEDRRVNKKREQKRRKGRRADELKSLERRLGGCRGGGLRVELWASEADLCSFISRPR